jgi:integral membrane sensor domain MASE1
MNITSPILASAARIAELPGDSVASLLKIVGTGTGLFDDSPDGGLGMIMSALAGVAAALAVAIALSIYFRSGYRSRRDLVKHGLAASAVLVLLAFVISDMRHAALAYLGINPSKPAVEFEIRLPKAALSATSDTPETHDAFAIRYRVLVAK